MKGIVAFKSENDLKVVLAQQYMKSIQNFFGDDKLALEFLTNVVATVQRIPALLDCEPETLLNSFMTMASLKLMPSAVSGEAYVLPYKNKGVMQAQFQLGYKGLVTLLYRAGNREVVAELVRENDKFALSRGKIVHEVDPRKTNEERGRVIGAYAIITTPLGGTVEQYMTMADIQAHAKKFSKAFSSEFSPWNASNDPQGWMPRKTVLIQTCKLAPKSGDVMQAIAEDYKDSIFADRKEASDLRLGPVGADVDDAQVKQYEAWLRDCKTKGALDRVWADIPGDYKPKVRSVMEEVKAMITSEVEPEIV